MTHTPGPRVTLLVPTIGRIDFLPAMIRSLEHQTYRNFEVLVLDNACSGRAVGEVSGWAARDSRVRVLRTEVRVPMLANFNRGIAAASAEYLAFCHDDDCLRSSYLERHVAFMDAHPSVGFVGSNYDFIDEHGSVFDRLHSIRDDGTWRGRDYILTLMCSEYNPLTMQSIFFRSSAAKQRGFDEVPPPHFLDYVFLMRIAETHDVGRIAAPLIEVRRHTGQDSASLRASMGLILRAKILDAYCKEYAGRWPRDAHGIATMNAGRRATHRRASLRAWLEAGSHEEAAACLAELADTPVDRALGVALHKLEQLGVGTARRQRVARALYRIKRTIRATTAK